jgi:hypothetical protein
MWREMIRESCHRRSGFKAAAFLSAGAAALFLGAMDGAGQDGGGGQEFEVVYYDSVDEDGNLVGGRMLMPVIEGLIVPAGSNYTTIIDNGPSANRVDLVCVGDGYLEGELDSYATHVDEAIVDLLSVEPFTTYSTYFNVHRVDVVSNESGVDHDPTYPIWRDTALGMGFWCGGTERALCVDVGAALSHAASAPDADQVFAVANSTKYGGVGYTSSDLATFAGANSLAAQIAIHELGHSLGDLADEYDYGGGVNWNGGEVPEPNVSIMDAAEMAANGGKWAAWLGENQAEFDGLVDCYEGARYYQQGIFRPSSNSMMRALARPFNLPSVEALIIEIYQIVRPIDDSTPTAQTLEGDETVWVEPLRPLDHELSIQWILDGEPIEGATGETLDLSTVAMDPGTHSLRARVRDNTDWVRNEAARNQWMTQSLQWNVEVPPESAVIQSFSIARGQLISGGLGHLEESDNSRLKIESEFTGANPSYLMIADITMMSGVDDPSLVDIHVESKITQNGGTAKLYLKNWNTGAWVLVRTYPIGRTEQLKKALNLNANDFVRASGMIRLRIRHEMPFSEGGDGFDSHVDLVRALVR